MPPAIERFARLPVPTLAAALTRKAGPVQAGCDRACPSGPIRGGQIDAIDACFAALPISTRRLRPSADLLPRP